MDANTNRLGVADYAVLAATLVLSSGIGLFYRLTGGRQKTVNEYLLADGQMSALPVAFSLMASFMSAITLLGVTYENYAFGTQFVAINIAYIIGTPVAGYVFLPVFFRQHSPSAYAYLEARFGLVTRLAASLAFSLQMVLYMGIVLYAPALALSAVTGMHYIGSILAVGIVCTFYSTLGGIKAVLITDVFQSLLMFAAIGAVLVGGTLKVGGIANVIQIATEGNRMQFFNFDVDPTTRHTIWTQIIGGTFIYCSIYAVNQAQVQRLLTTRSVAHSQLALWLQWPILTALSLTTSLAGLVLYAYYRDCDPVSSGRIFKGDQLLPLFVVDTMSDTPGLSGLFISGIFSGSLSTVSSAINSLAAVTLEDYIRPFMDVPPARATLLLKCLALFFGIISLILTFVVEALGPGVLQASLTIFGVVGGPLLGLFSLGMMTTTANEPGALTGFMSSLAVLFWFGFGQPKPPVDKLPLSTTECLNQTSFIKVDSVVVQEYFYPYRISYAWYACMGCISTVLIGLAVSAIFQKISCVAKKQLHPDLFVTPLRNRLLAKHQSLTDIAEDNIKTSSSIGHPLIALPNNA